MEFGINDIVKFDRDDKYYRVTGVIHDDERLFLTYEDEREFEVPFMTVCEHWAKKL